GSESRCDTFQLCRALLSSLALDLGKRTAEGVGVENQGGGDPMEQLERGDQNSADRVHGGITPSWRDSKLPPVRLPSPGAQPGVPTGGKVAGSPRAARRVAA